MAKKLKPKTTTAQEPEAKPSSPMDQLESDFAKVDAHYLTYARKQQVYSDRRDDMKKRFSGMNDVFMTQMMMTCASPLRDGVNFESVITCLSMYMGMRMGSKDFRQKSDMALTKMKYEICNAAAQKQGPDSKYAAEAEKYRRGMVMQKNGGRYPFTAHSAALTKIAMTQQAYADMRVPGADTEDIMSKYNTAMSVLNMQCREDGVLMSAVNQHMRLCVGRMGKADPQFAATFNELSYDGIKRAPGKEDPNNPGSRVWTGEYQNREGQPYNDGFTPREPLTVESAAYRKFVYAKSAYEAMRVDGADVLEVQARYEDDMQSLSAMCAVDGIDEHAVNQQMRIMVGEMARKDPSVMDMFNETTYQGVRRAPYHKNASGQAEWTGEYMNADGSKFDGAFTPRSVMTEQAAANWKMRAAEQAYDDMRDVTLNPNEVIRRYTKADKLFGQWCAADGLDVRDIDRQARIQVGERCVEQPEYAATFGELADSSEDAVRPAVAHYDYADDDGSRVWTGEYVNGRGEPFKGFFTPRAPIGRDDAVDHFCTNSNFMFMQVKSQDAFDMAVAGYESAYAQVFGKPPKTPDDSMKSNIAYQYSVMTLQALSNDSQRFGDVDKKSFPSMARVAMDNAYGKGFENIVCHQFVGVPSHAELAKSIDAYEYAYGHVFGNGQGAVPDDVKSHHVFQQTVGLLETMRDSGMSKEAINDTFDATKVSACMTVDKNVYAAFAADKTCSVEYSDIIEGVTARVALEKKMAHNAKNDRQNQGGNRQPSGKGKNKQSGGNKNRGDIAANRFGPILDADGQGLDADYSPK